VRALQGKSVLVTGASRGLGRAIAAEFLRAAADLVGTGRDAMAMMEAEKYFETIGGNVRMVHLDVRDEPTVVELFAGLQRLDVLVNNAGIARSCPFTETSTQEMRDVIETNLIGAFVVMREAVKKMLEHGGGYVINIGSDASVRGIGGMGPYVASKHGLLGMTRSLRQEMREQGIRAATFCPGAIDTEIMGPGTSNPHALPPEDIARTIVHMASLPASVEIQEMLVQPTHGHSPT